MPPHGNVTVDTAIMVCDKCHGEIEDPNATEEQRISQDSKTSYFTLKQYNVLNKRIMEANYRIKEQQTMIDSLDKTVADTLN